MIPLVTCVMTGARRLVIITLVYGEVSIPETMFGLVGLDSFASLIAWALLFIVFIYVVYNLAWFTWQEWTRRKQMMKFPGITPRNFLLGHIVELPDVAENGLRWVRNRIEEYPRCSFFFFGPQVVCNIFDPVLAKPIFKSSEPKPREFGGYKFVRPWLGDGLLLAGGAKWARNRRLLTPAFHFDILRPYMNVNNQAAEVLLDKLDKFEQNDEYFEVFSHISLLTLDIILRCAFSYEIDCQNQGDGHPYVKAVAKITGTMTDRYLLPWLYPDLIFNLSSRGREANRSIKYVHKIAEEIIKKRKATLNNSSKADQKDKKYLDFLDILLTARDDAGNGLSDLEIRNEVDTFLFEGHDTTASGISWALHSLAEHPEHQTKCQKEIDSLLDGRDSEQITWEDMSQLPHLTMCLKEALRYHTPVPFIERITTKDVYIDGYFVPAGTMVDLQIYIMQHNPYVWEDPMKFDPERFLPERIKDKDSFSFVPFSAGPRNCIGQNFAMHEMKVAIARILRRFTLKLDPQRPAKHQIMVVMKTEDGMYMKAERRERGSEK